MLPHAAAAAAADRAADIRRRVLLLLLQLLLLLLLLLLLEVKVRYEVAQGRLRVIGTTECAATNGIRRQPAPQTRRLFALDESVSG